MTQKLIEAKRAEIEAKQAVLGKMQYRLWAMSHDSRRDDTGEKYYQSSPCSHRRFEKAIFGLCEEIYQIQLEIDDIQYEMDAH